MGAKSFLRNNGQNSLKFVENIIQTQEILQSARGIITKTTIYRHSQIADNQKRKKKYWMQVEVKIDILHKGEKWQERWLTY